MNKFRIAAWFYGPEHAKRIFSRMYKAFPDLRADIESMVAEGDTVALRLTLSGTHQPTDQPC
jgi:predicted ester cyclase